jgi:hypothetical protein
VPFATVPKLTLDGVVATVPALELTPVPLTAYSTLLLVALLVNNTYPENSPVLDGANFTEIGMKPPTEMVCGIVNPLTLNPVACTASAEITTGAAPLFWMVKEIVLLDPTATDPKLADDGPNISLPWDSRPCPCALPAKKANANSIEQPYATYLRRSRRCPR